MDILLSDALIAVIALLLLASAFLRRLQIQSNQSIITTRRERVTTRFMILTGLMIAFFWFIYSIFGKVPTVETIVLTKNISHTLVLQMSRWKDIFIGVFWIMAYIYISYDKDLIAHYNDSINTKSGKKFFFLILFFGSLNGLIYLLELTTTTGPLIIYVFTVVSALTIKPDLSKKSNKDGLRFQIGTMLVFTFPTAVIAGIDYGIITMIIIVMGISTGMLIRQITSKKNWEAVGKFMFAKEK